MIPLPIGDTMKDQEYIGFGVKDTVYIKATQQAAYVVGVYLMEERITYDVRYWLDGEAVTVTLEGFELSATMVGMQPFESKTVESFLDGYDPQNALPNSL